MSDVEPRAYALLPIGKTVSGRYRVESVIGEGAHSVVYAARRAGGPVTIPDDPIDAEPLSDLVALKVIHRHLSGDRQVFLRFQREAKILEKLQGEHVVKLLDVVEEDGLLIIVLEHVAGTSLEILLKEKSPLDVREAVEITIQICAALGAAHASGIVHRDLKPANVLVERRGPGDLRVKVLDFGLARVLFGQSGAGTSNLTEHGMIFGTPEYMAPEQARGDEADARADLYAAGVMLYEMATGELPFKGRSAIGAMTAHLTEAPPSPRAARPDGAISPALSAVILRALAKEPADRYPSARDLAEAIDGARSPATVIAPDGAVDASELSSSDTDLNVVRPSIGTANTVPTIELSESAREELKKAEAALLGQARTVSVPTTPIPPAPPRRTAMTSVPPTLESAGNEPPSRSRWLWAVVALVAAAIGVVIGAIAGAR